MLLRDIAQYDTILRQERAQAFLCGQNQVATLSGGAFPARLACYPMYGLFDIGGGAGH